MVDWQIYKFYFIISPSIVIDSIKWSAECKLKFIVGRRRCCFIAIRIGFKRFGQALSITRHGIKKDV